VVAAFRGGDPVAIGQEIQNSPWDSGHYGGQNLVNLIKSSLGQPTGGGAEAMISDVDNEYGRWEKLGYQIRNRHLTRDEFRKSAVGNSWLTAMEALSDDPEADRATQAQEVGRVAVADNWEGQINSLVQEMGGIKVEIVNLKINAVNLTADLKKAQDSSDIFKGQVGDLTVDLVKANKKVADLEKQLKENPIPAIKIDLKAAIIKLLTQIKSWFSRR
jgi:hypothetical protein